MNNLANNSPYRKPKEGNPISSIRIEEVEVSITNQCNLSCIGCGFNIPNQISPTGSLGVNEHVNTFKTLNSIGVSFGKIVIVGGEPSLSKNLHHTIIEFKKLGVADNIEIVTNGFYPKGLNKSILNGIDSIVISDYSKDDEFEELWRKYLNSMEYSGHLYFRKKDAWDDLLGETSNSKENTMKHWHNCFYRRCDTTIERGRIFSCSRIAKKGWDDQGLLIDEGVTLLAIINHLTSKEPMLGCYSCQTVNSISNIPVAEQKKTNISILKNKAKDYLYEITKNK